MNTVLVLLFLLGFSPFVVSQPPNNAAPYSIPPNTRPYYKLALQWGYSLCNSGSRCTPPYPSIHPPHRFTIHGLWPDFHPRQARLTSAPANCRTIGYTTIQDKNQLADMNKYWPNVLNQSDNAGFWEKQWEKHGTCALPQLTQHQFFNTALDLVKRLNLDPILKAGGLKIGGPNNANLALLIQKSTIGVIPEVVCKTNSTKHWQIREIRVCYDHHRNSWINCPNPSNSCRNTYEVPK